MRLLPQRHPPEEDLVALRDGELLLPERVTTQRHVTGCARCQDRMTHLERVFAALAAELATDPAGRTEQVLHWRLRPAVGAGAGVLAGSLGALLVATFLVRRHRRAVVT